MNDWIEIRLRWGGTWQRFMLSLARVIWAAYLIGSEDGMVMLAGIDDMDCGEGGGSLTYDVHPDDMPRLLDVLRKRCASTIPEPVE